MSSKHPRCTVGPLRPLLLAGAALAAAVVHAHGGYVVAVDSETAKSPEWTDVAQTLCRRRGGVLATYPKGETDALLPLLRKSVPRHVCFVSRPESAGRDLVFSAAQTIRRIDGDPFGDALWGIVTGYDAADAARMVSRADPLTIRRAATSMGGEGFFRDWESGFASDEGNRHRFWTKAPGGKALCGRVEPDSAKALADAFCRSPVEYWCTSGHATERNWQIVFNQNAGFIVHKDGGLFARDSSGASFPMCSQCTKVYVAAGNCLIGHIDRRDCMATAWMHSGGVDQMVGYTVVTFYGFMGWGVKSLFESGGHSLAESFFLCNQILLWKLRRLNPELAEKRIDAKGGLSRGEMSAKLKGAAHSRDEFGLLWDRDSVAFYGDPAWRVTCPEERRKVDVAVNGDDITIRFLHDAEFPDSLDAKDLRPVAFMLPPSLRGGGAVTDAAGKPVEGAVASGCFALVPVTGRHAAGETLRLKMSRTP